VLGLIEKAAEKSAEREPGGPSLPLKLAVMFPRVYARVCGRHSRNIESGYLPKGSFIYWQEAASAIYSSLTGSLFRKGIHAAAFRSVSVRDFGFGAAFIRVI